MPDYIDEWVSAPYAVQVSDRGVIVPGLAWMEEESQRRFTKKFAALSVAEQSAIADDICLVSAAKPEFRKAAAFFAKFRALAASAYYGTEAGWKAIGYVGNMALARFDGPPPEVLEMAGNKVTAIAAARRAGMRTLREDGIAKVEAGLTSIQEVARVCGTT